MTNGASESVRNANVQVVKWVIGLIRCYHKGSGWILISYCLQNPLNVLNQTHPLVFTYQTTHDVIPLCVYGRHFFHFSCCPPVSCVIVSVICVWRYSYFVWMFVIPLYVFELCLISLLLFSHQHPRSFFEYEMRFQHVSVADTREMNIKHTRYI